MRTLLRMIDAGVAWGIPRNLLVAAAGLTDADFADVDSHVPLTAEIALWQTLARRISDPAFGVLSGARFRIGAAGLPGYVLSFSATVRDASCRLARYSRLFSETVQFRLEESNGQGAITLVNRPLGAASAFAEDFRLAAVLTSVRTLSGVDIVPMQVDFTSDAPANTLAHREFFRCPLHFGAPASRLVFRASDLDLPIAKGDETLAGYLSDYAEHVLASLTHGETMQHTVRAAIWSVLGNGMPSLQRVAAVLHMPARTIQRRLAAEGTTFHHEVEEIRKAMAMATLRDPSLAIGDVAFLLGYSEPSTFYRSFKRWTGTTPRQFRAAAA